MGGSFRTSPEGYRHVPLARLKPAKINDKTYKPISPDDAATVQLAEAIRQTGIVDPLNVTPDMVIISGHRRRVACQLLGITEVPIKVLPVLSTDPEFPTYLVNFNRQRVKSADEMVREEVIRTSPEDAHNALLAYREVESAKAHARPGAAGLRVLSPSAARKRAAISAAKRPMLEAAVAVIDKYREYWPLTLRQIHYRLLGQAVLRHAGKPGSRYVNSIQCYRDLSDLLTRARLLGLAPWESMHDPTRPRTTWTQWDSPGPYVREQLDGFLCSYKRNLLQSQPAYVELVVEKITVQEIAERAAGRYHVPVGVGRGYTSVTSLEDTAERFRASGKDRFILLIAGDFDPEGENICETWAAKLRDEHGVGNITPVKVAVNPDQIRRYDLKPLPVKEGSSRRRKFVEAHGSSVYELEAFEPDQLQAIIRDAIRGVLDMDLLAEEQRQESEDARYLMAYRSQVREVLRDCEPDPDARGAP